jgi:N-acetylneuraminate lyase
MDKNKFRGVFTALLTPMHEDGRLDLESLERLVEHQITQGIQGFYVGGSTGEGFILTSEERMNVLKTVVQAAKGRVTLISHVGCISTMESIRLARHAESLGVDAVSAVVPFYYKVGPTEISEHYRAIMSSVSLPMIIYHFPGATGVQLSLDFYEEMARNPQCIGVKFTSLNLFEMQQIRSRCGEGFLIWNGHDEVYAGGALMGADGAIGSTFNMLPGLFAKLCLHQARSDWSTVQALQTQANTVIAHMLNYDVIPYEKYILYLQGIIRHPAVRQPLRQFTSVERAEIEAFYPTSEPLQIPVDAEGSSRRNRS